MNQPTTGLAALVLLLAYLCYHVFRTYSTLKDIPGPFWARFTNLQRLLWVKTFRSHEIYQKSHEEYGDLVRIGPNVVSVADPAAIPALYPMRAGFPKVRICLRFQNNWYLGDS